MELKGEFFSKWILVCMMVSLFGDSIWLDMSLSCGFFFVFNMSRRLFYCECVGVFIMFRMMVVVKCFWVIGGSFVKCFEFNNFCFLVLKVMINRFCCWVGSLFLSEWVIVIMVVIFDVLLLVFGCSFFFFILRWL